MDIDLYLTKEEQKIMKEHDFKYIETVYDMMRCAMNCKENNELYLEIQKIIIKFVKEKYLKIFIYWNKKAEINFNSARENYAIHKENLHLFD